MSNSNSGWDGMSSVEGLFLAVVEARAVSDFHCNKVHNGFEKGTPEHDAYARQINKLEKIKPKYKSWLEGGRHG